MRNKLSVIEKILHVFKEIGSEIPIQQMLLLVAVAQNQGRTMPELQESLGMPQGTLSRNVKALGVYLVPDPDNPQQKKKDGYDLLITRPDLENRKSLAVYLSSRGEEVIAQLKSVVPA
jgi:hypothetical protein